jgi:serine/threonine-protein kinase
MIGTRIGAYEIQALLGVGGMGEVYRARDSKLGRDVAIKILPKAFTGDPDRYARFEREARMLAALNHPNIATIHGLEETTDAGADASRPVRAIVMELVPGDTLAQRIARGPLVLAETLAIARQIADALDAAHEKGIVHRDLKPANITITPDGLVKVLDFGLAKIASGAVAVDLTAAPTISVGGTREGVVVGTAAYMSPEQARGQTVDKRTDIWAFGCVLYELLAGRRAFPGETVSDTISGILSRDPDWSQLPAETPAHVRQLLTNCLEKDPKRRLRDIGDVRLESAAASSPATAADGLPRGLASPSARSLLWAAVALLIGVAGFVVGSSTRPTPGAAEVSRVFVQSPTPPVQLAVSRDGRRIAYRGPGQSVLSLRALDQFDARPVPGTEGAEQPFFSPDGNWIGFFVPDGPGDNATLRGRLMKVAVSGGPAIALSDAVLLGATWGEDDTIVLPRAADEGIGLYRIPATGGTPERVTAPDTANGEFRHGWPEFTPGGDAILFSISGQATFDGGRIAALSLRSGDVRTVVDQGYHPRVVAGGHLAYVLGGTLMTVPFDARTLRTSGTAVRAVESIRTQPISGVASFGVSASGTLAYAVAESSRRTLTWVERDGRSVPLAIEPDMYAFPRLSADEGRLAVGIEREGRDVWIVDLERQTRNRITADRGNDPPPPITAWTPDGTRLDIS